MPGDLVLKWVMAAWEHREVEDRRVKDILMALGKK